MTLFICPAYLYHIQWMNVNDYIYSPYVLFNIPCLYVACWTNNFIVLLKPHGMKELKIIKLYFCFTVFKYSLILYNIFISVLCEKIMLLYTARKESLSEVWHLIQNGKSSRTFYKLYLCIYYEHFLSDKPESFIPVLFALET